MIVVKGLWHNKFLWTPRMIQTKRGRRLAWMVQINRRATHDKTSNVFGWEYQERNNRGI